MERRRRRSGLFITESLREVSIFWWLKIHTKVGGLCIRAYIGESLNTKKQVTAFLKRNFHEKRDYSLS